ncbi:MFS transporter, partial [Klebsiella pneumoniae]
MAYRNVPASARAGLTARVMLVALIVPAVAPALGGWLVDSLSWRGIFFASVAPALLVLALASGAGLAFAALGDGQRPVNVFWALA